MRQLVLGTIGRRVSWTLVTALLLPLLIMAAPPRQARAQLARIPAVAVLDFGVLTDSRTSAILGRNATDAVVVEMTRTGRYDPISRTQLNQQLQESGLTQPLNNNGIQKLGQALGVDFVASGDVTSITFTDNPRRARVTLSVRLTDVISGELSNGAIQTGISAAPPPGSQPDDETLVNQAISDAAFAALKTINNYTLPEATVLQTRDTSEVRLNRGGRDGLVPGQEMIVIRGRDLIGRIRVTSVAASDSLAAVTDYGKGIRPEDKARAVFQLPGYSVAASGLITSTPPQTTQYQPRNRNTRPVLTTILLVGAAIFLAVLLFSPRSRTNGNGVGKVEARAFSEGSTPVTSSTAATADPSARVQVTWSAAADVPTNNVLEYHVYRDESIIGVVSRNQTTFIDSSVLGQFGGGLTALTVTYGGAITNPFSSGNIVGGGNNGTTTNGTTTNTNGNNNNNNNNGNNNNNNNGNSQATGQLTTISGIIATPLTVGVPHTYRVEVVFQQILANNPGQSGGNTTGGGTGVGNNNGTTGGATNGNTGGGGNNGGNNGGGGNNNTSQIAYKVGNIQSVSGVATPVARPQTVGPVSDQNLANIRVTFRTVQGADQYILEFARDPSFSKKVSRGPFFSAFSGGGTTQSDILDLSNDFNNVAAGGRIYYRVGARNSQDSPGPLKRGVPNGDNYIYSGDSLSFAKLGNPPAPPQLTP